MLENEFHLRHIILVSEKQKEEKKKNRCGSQASESTQRCYLFILITVSGDGEGVRNDGIELVSI